MSARIALVAVPTLSQQDRPAQTTLSLCARLGRGASCGQVGGLFTHQKEQGSIICIVCDPYHENINTFSTLKSYRTSETKQEQ